MPPQVHVPLGDGSVIPQPRAPVATAAQDIMFHMVEGDFQVIPLLLQLDRPSHVQCMLLHDLMQRHQQLITCTVRQGAAGHAVLLGEHYANEEDVCRCSKESGACSQKQREGLGLG